MSRLFILGIIVFLVVYLLKRQFQAPKQKLPKAPFNNEKMVKCAHCGVHVPISEAVSLDDQFYCSAAHQPPK
jgi:uncharacterized protein